MCDLPSFTICSSTLHTIKNKESYKGRHKRSEMREVEFKEEEEEEEKSK